jgi:carboxyl-terminal processing protease
VLRTVAWVASAALGYAAGVATGVIGSQGGNVSASPATPTAASTVAPDVGVLDEAADRIAARAARHVQREDLERAAVEAMLAHLDDTWSSYYRPSEFRSFQDALAGRYAGVGLWLRPAPAGGVEVASVQEGSPSSAAAIVPGEHVVGIDGVAVGASTVNTVASLLRGEGGSRVVLVLGPGGDATAGIGAGPGGGADAGVDLPPRATHSVVLDRVTFTAQDLVVERLGEDVLALTVSGFSRGVGRDVQRALATDSARHAGGVVLDLRGNPGGLLDEGVSVASVFLDGGRVVSYRTRSEGTSAMDAAPGGDVTTPVVVLVDEGTASAAEVVAGALQDRGRAVVVGSRTFGKGSVQEPSRLADGSAIEITVGHYATPSGRALEGVGIEPDVELPSTADPELVERRALEVLGGLMAALGPNGRG